MPSSDCADDEPRAGRISRATEPRGGGGVLDLGNGLEKSDQEANQESCGQKWQREKNDLDRGI